MRDVPHPDHYGVVEGDPLEPGILKIRSAVEKPSKPRSNHAIMPVYMFTEDIFTALSDLEPGRDGEVQLTDAIQRLVTNGKPVIGVQLRPDEVMLDLGSPETMIQALRLSLRYASGGEDAMAENAEPRRTAGGPADRDSQDRMLAHNVSLPLLLPVMIQVPTHKGPD